MAAAGLACAAGLMTVATACTPPAGDPASDGPASEGPASEGPLSDGPVSDGPVGGAGSVTIDRLIDGDSMDLVIDGDPTEVRLLGINAPELDTTGGAESCNGREAGRALEEILASGPLRLESFGTDRFGRLLGRLHAGEVEVNRAMVAQGWALGLWSADDITLPGLMQDAAAARVGVWGDTCGRPEAALEIVGEQVDPPGRDEENLGQEWVELANPGPAAVDLDGWSIADETTSNRFPLPALTLAAGDRLIVRTGPGPATPGEIHLGRDFPVWNNRGETVLLVDPEGRIAGHRFVP